MMAVREAWKAGLFGRSHWAPNLISGVIVGVVALPLAMAFAIASGARPEQGIYTAIIAGLCVSLLGGSRLQIAGPTGAFVVILSGVTATHGIDGLQIATLMAGALILLLGISRLGALVRFIPEPVIAGFTAGIGIVIWVGQWKSFFGLNAATAGVPEPGAAAHFHEQLWALLRMLPVLDSGTTLLGLASLLLVLLGPRIPGLARVPGPLIALCAATLLQGLHPLPGVATIGSAFGGIPAGLPQLSFPEVTLDRVIALIGPALAIAMLGAIESLLSAVVADNMAGTRHDSSQELIGQGLANLLTPLFGGFAATGAIARTATNVRNGGTGPLSGVIHALTLVAVLWLLAPLASGIPLCTLAAILFVVSWNMSQPAHVLHIMRHAPRTDVVILVVTCVLTVLSDLVLAVQVGVLLAVLNFLRRMARSVNVRMRQVAPSAVDAAAGAAPMWVHEIEGPVFFGVADTLEQTLLAPLPALNTPTGAAPCVVLDLALVPFMDFTGIVALEKVIRQLQQRGSVVHLCRANPRVRAKLGRAGVLTLLGEAHVHDQLAPWETGQGST